MKLKSTKNYSKLKPEPEPYIMKKQRTKTTRRLRQKISPIVISPTANSVSCDSSRVTFDSNAKKRKLHDLDGSSNTVPVRRITRSYYKQLQDEKRFHGVNDVEVSEASSCVESNSEADFAAISANNVRNGVVSSASEARYCKHKKSLETEQLIQPEFSKNDAVSVDESSVVDQKSKSSLGFETDLSCAEQFSYDDVVSEYSSSHENDFSELFEVFQSSSDGYEFSDDYTPSIFFDSGSQFSEKSTDDSTQSPTYSLSLEFRRQFLRSSVSLDPTGSSLMKAECLNFEKFKNEDDEDSYQRLRERERRQLFLHDYVEVYRSTTEYGELVSQQRLLMVHWIIEQATAKKLQQETLFLGVSLLDRFLSKGLFKSLKNLQIVGIACLALATRIEENQPYNCVRQRNFHIESNKYTRTEVVAMEWVVQEILNFQCLLPTIHNFMWFYLKAAKADAEMEKTARYLARLALSVNEHLRYWPSTVAAGLVILASLLSEQMESYQRVIEVHIRTKENDLHECIKTMEWLIQYVS
ncbi:cyclin-SDS [Mercurialis annua]|uniref:cyclin-SDS n=1 Tax=Mercurialis annua TaxID=3986 RepID=UPI002160B7F5|nr:cyclin-SDS [Mercurialis annua]